jgi:glutamate-1-semialdehyde 2,1-aminomutase
MGTSFGAPTALEVELAGIVTAAMPSVELVRFVNSGTEACMSALRLARAFTRRDKIIKCAGCYHGHADALLVSAGSGALTFGVPDSPGVSESQAADTIVVPYNDAKAVEAAFERYPDEIACVIVEPIAGNMGMVLPGPGYLQALRATTARAGALLIFDEVMTGFRVAYGGAQSVYDIVPDLTCLGKVIGAGLPVGAFGGKREIMNRLAPDGDVYQAGTLSGNPLAMAAGIAQLRALAEPGVYAQLESNTALLVRGWRDAFADAGVATQTAHAGSMWGFFFNASPVTDLASAKVSDTKAFAVFFEKMLEHGVYLAPSQFEAAFVSLAHSQDDFARTIAAVRASL